MTYLEGKWSPMGPRKNHQISKFSVQKQGYWRPKKTEVAKNNLGHISV